MSQSFKSCCFLALLPFLTNGLYAQDYGYAPRDYSIVPPTPEVASLLDFKEFPIDYFRGIPEISYPIFTLKCGSITIPITLSYHGGGIRNMQQYGNAGLGWDVTYGAVIGHNVNGFPDDAKRDPSNIHGLWHLTDAEKDFRKKLIAKRFDYDPSDISVFRNELYWQSIEGQRHIEGRTDLANDLYTISGLGLSAVFAYDDNKNIIVSSDTPLMISKASDLPKINDGGCDAYGLEVRDYNGLNYKFMTLDRSRYDYNHGDPDVTQLSDSIYYTSAWHISEVRDPSDNVIKYSYIKSPRSIIESSSRVVRRFIDPELNRYHLQSLSSSTGTIYYPNVIDEITDGKIKVKFEYVIEDGYNGFEFSYKKVPLINKIIISDVNGSERVFSFQYFKDSSKVPLLLSIKDQGTAILKFDYDNGGVSDWRFYYDSQDFGGYNNELSQGTIVPTINDVGDSADRNVYPEAARKGSLKRITYPTGGTTDLEWESNTFSHIGPHEYSGIINGTNTLSVVKDTLRMCMDENYKKLTIKDWSVTSSHRVMIDLKEYFCMNPALIALTEYEEDHSFYIDNYTDKNKPVYPHVRFKRQGDNNYNKVIFLDKSTIEKSDDLLELFLTPGIYDVELVYPTEINGAKADLEANMRYYDSLAGKIYLYRTKTMQNVNPDKNNNLWCGLRIKRITSSAADGEEPIRKDFYYNTAFDPYMTSGTVQMLPEYNYHNYMTFQSEMYEPGQPIYCKVTQINNVGTSAFPGTPLGNFSSIEYPEIATRLSKSDRFEPDGYLHYMAEKYYYTSSRTSSNMDENEFPFKDLQPVGARMITSRSHHRGLLSKKVVGDPMGYNTQSVSYQYNVFEPQSPPILTTSAFILCDFTRTPSWVKYGGFDYGIGKYSLIPYNKTTASETVEESNGIISEKRYEYFYDTYTSNLDYGLVKSVSSTTSEGNSVSTYYTYLHGNINGEYMFLPEQETEVTVVDGKIVSAVRNEYDPATRLLLRKYELPDNYNGTNLLSANQRTTAAQTQAISELAYEYRYNQNGNLIEIKYRGIPLALYLWGYNGLYPVIEAAGVSYDTLRAGLLSAGMTAQQIDGRAIDTQMQIKTVSDRLRSSLPEASVSSIAYHWLLGIIEMTDGTGRSTTYDYDTRGRLVEVRDFNNYLIQKYNYNTYSYGQN